MTKTRQQMVEEIKSTIPQAYAAAGQDDHYKRGKMDLWADGTIYSSAYDRFFRYYQQQGLTQFVQNIILNFFNLSSVGFDTYKDKKKHLGDTYRAALAAAQQAVDRTTALLEGLQQQRQSATDPVWQHHLDVEIAVEASTLRANISNRDTWKATLDHAITVGEAV